MTSSARGSNISSKSRTLAGLKDLTTALKRAQPPLAPASVAGRGSAPRTYEALPTGALVLGSWAPGARRVWSRCVAPSLRGVRGTTALPGCCCLPEGVGAVLL